MARKTAEITITAEGRDLGKKFILTEMGATQAEKWATKALLAMGHSGADIPEDIAQAGMAGLAALSVRALTGIAFYEAEPLMDEMFTCVKIIEPAVPLGRATTDDDIEEVATRIKLREEVLSLHLGFSIAERVSLLISALRALNTSNTSTSDEALAP